MLDISLRGLVKLVLWVNVDLVVSTGLPMCVTYFVHPYEVLKCPELLSADKGVCLPEGVGMGGRMGVEKSSQVFHLSVDPNLFK